MSATSHAQAQGGAQQSAHDEHSKRDQLVLAAWTTLALALGQVATWLLNVTLYPSFDSFFSWARDINQTWSGLVAIAFVAIAMRWPRIMVGKVAKIITPALLVCGYALAVAGSALQSAALATVGTCTFGLSSILIAPFLCLSLVRLEPQWCLGSLLVSIVVGYALMAALWLTPLSVKFVLLLVVRLGQAILVIVLARPVCVRVIQAGAPADLSITNPLSFLPATNWLFIAIFLFQTVYGYMITFGSVQSYPQPVLLASLFVLAVAIYVLVRRRLSADLFYGVAFVLVLAGLFVASAEGVRSVSLGTFSLAALTNILLSAGSDMFHIAISFVLAAIGRRNVAEAVPVGLLNSIASSFGVGAGALLGLANNALIAAGSPVANLLPLAGAFLFATYNFFLVRSFSFDRTVSNLLPMEPLRAGSVRDDEDATETQSANASTSMESSRVAAIPAAAQPNMIPAASDPLTPVCDNMAREYHLTPREAEVFGMLAHGRNVAYMQQELTLSRNTIKTHVANVYGKLDVHSHQELIDLVEARAAG